MLGDVEVAKPEGEIDRIDVLERRCEEDDVRRQIDRGDEKNGFGEWTVRRHGGEHLR
jgi:hypothetical protein